MDFFAWHEVGYTRSRSNERGIRSRKECIVSRRSVIANILKTTAIAFSISVGAHAADSGAAQGIGDTAMDAAINGMVAAALMSDPGLLGARIDIDTQDGIVSLAGTVIGEREVRRALDIASDIEGVRRVDNLLQVDHSR